MLGDRLSTPRMAQGEEEEGDHAALGDHVAVGEQRGAAQAGHQQGGQQEVGRAAPVLGFHLGDGIERGGVNTGMQKHTHSHTHTHT